MDFVVTARKWRPKKFSELIGQEHITTTLQNSIRSNRIAHAYLFTGPRGVGKTSTARILAKTLNCLNPKDTEPCNECEICKIIHSNQSLDIIEIDGASNRGIDEIRTLRESVKYAPTKGKYKVYIIDEVHMLTKESFNAFLKTLEEPPSHTIFIFATTDVHKVPLTIISRCQRYDFRRIHLDTIKSALKAIADDEKIKIDDKTLSIIAKKADGSLRDAESYFDQVVAFCDKKIDPITVSKMLNLIDDDIYFRISDAVLGKNFKTVFEITNEIYENGWNFIDFMEGLLEHFRNILTVVLNKKTDLIETAEANKLRYAEYEEKFTSNDILRLLNFLTKVQQELRFSQNHKLKIEIALSHLVGLEKTSTLSEIITKLVPGQDNTPLFLSEQSSSKYSAGQTNKNLSEVKRVQTEPKEFSSSSIVINEKVENIILNEVTDFDGIVKKWESFVNSISQERSLIFGPMIKNLRPMNLEGNKLKVSGVDENGKYILKRNQDYINKKVMDVFGRKLNLQFSDVLESAEPEVQSSSAENTNKKQSKKDIKTKDPLIDAIINELGGQEIE
ncbi:MAG: DNA polymerase III, subunit gamma and tau [Ignavibacteria bacterium RIFOXYB2_FULL_35_12]|nr:MAG: DNA polymerase III, subunit gamma and tau [Ignavibacteria bacterium GWA2_36_19]OGU58141.1 MAG: DNA polymerase III, subunit gamma and tau [Ignavibacteria bacterium GWF2_35_20]OGU89688.1 MAG: DNA polymerase III, subunit gamma and tau [Ignavibacteria bacterium RIFOXYC12_FULL_35_11]OGU90065.1 MAG: DNA polymerase III, subunit gamma and tau [Ignavibacteria bacterium RIFOXYA12_FULL_35_25]OGU95516.1 MAG: DNA polymerase III, subunit gamma and tau [Ignavibacteria bacterium RIFOXYB12_FULL_35_14]O